MGIDCRPTRQILLVLKVKTINHDAKNASLASRSRVYERRIGRTNPLHGGLWLHTTRQFVKPLDSLLPCT